MGMSNTLDSVLALSRWLCSLLDLMTLEMPFPSQEAMANWLANWESQRLIIPGSCLILLKLTFLCIRTSEFREMNNGAILQQADLHACTHAILHIGLEINNCHVHCCRMIKMVLYQLTKHFFSLILYYKENWCCGLWKSCIYFPFLNKTIPLNSNCSWLLSKGYIQQSMGFCSIIVNHLNFCPFLIQERSTHFHNDLNIWSMVGPSDYNLDFNGIYYMYWERLQRKHPMHGQWNPEHQQ